MFKTVVMMGVCVSAVCGLCLGQVDFETYFEDQTLRVDFYQTGDQDELFIALDQLYQVPVWAGCPDHLIDDLNRGTFQVRLVDPDSETLIYSRGFCALFGEYKTTDDAAHNIKQTFHETVLVPYPKQPCTLILDARNRAGIFEPVFETRIDPADVNIIRQAVNPQDKVVKTLESGHPHHKVDFVFVAEGYTESEWNKFQQDVQRFTEVIFRPEPYRSHKDRFNISGVFHASPESGVDEPTKGVFKNTIVSASYNALGTPRYLLVDDTKAIRDIAQAVPYDYVLVLTNTTRYGGGGIYNNYTIFTADDRRSEEILMHEFGHGFADLADEYFGGVAYNDFYPAGVEPYAPNITALLDPNHVKWAHHLTPGIPIPTPWGQDEMQAVRDKIAASEEQFKLDLQALHDAETDPNEIKAAQNKHKIQIQGWRDEIDEIREHYLALYDGKIGVFEGAGYTPKGLYRSEIQVGMIRNFNYGPVSEEGIMAVIDHLSR